MQNRAPSGTFQGCLQGQAREGQRLSHNLASTRLMSLYLLLAWTPGLPRAPEAVACSPSKSPSVSSPSAPPVLVAAAIPQSMLGVFDRLPAVALGLGGTGASLLSPPLPPYRSLSQDAHASPCTSLQERVV